MEEEHRRQLANPGSPGTTNNCLTAFFPGQPG